jgi:hypothetical protein
MPPGEYFLVEYRYPCGFDADLKTGSSDLGDDRHGAALWHIDETGILGTKRNSYGYDEDVINYQTNAYPDDGTWPGRHYKVALVQADGDWDLERSLNRGDNTDLFQKSSNGKQADTAYKIGPDGLVMNNGSSKRTPNTNSYAYGYEKKTGITFEFGTQGSTMSMTVTFEGENPPPTPNTPNPTPRPSPSPTPWPVVSPTPAPMPLPTERLTPYPTPPPTSHPTPSPVTNPTLNPTELPVIASDASLGVGTFYFVNSETNQDIGLVTTCNGCFSPSTPVTIRAETFGDVQSVKLGLEGPTQLSFTKVENIVPYTLFGDNSETGDVFGQTFESGSYTVTAQAYSELYAGGAASDIKSVDFIVSAPTPPPTSNPVQQQRIAIYCDQYGRRKCLRQRLECSWDTNEKNCRKR